MSDRPPRVVAELGRPETPAETAERKAQARVLRRSRQTFRNLIASLGATVGLVAIIVLLVPRAEPPERPGIDVASVARSSADTAGQALVAPAVPAAWKSNAAELRGRGEDTSWYVGYVHGDSYAALTEGLPGTDRTIDQALQRARATGATTLAGGPWRVYDRRDRRDTAGNVAYALATRLGDVRLAVYGTDRADVERLAAAAVADARAKGLDGPAALP